MNIGRSSHGEEHRFGNLMVLDGIPGLQLTSCMTLNNLLNLSVLQFPYL